MVLDQFAQMCAAINPSSGLRHKRAMMLSAFKEVHCTSNYNYSRKYHPSDHPRSSIVFKK
jgi:hypothetical protein